MTAKTYFSLIAMIFITSLPASASAQWRARGLTGMATDSHTVVVDRFRGLTGGNTRVDRPPTVRDHFGTDFRQVDRVVHERRITHVWQRKTTLGWNPFAQPRTSYELVPQTTWVSRVKRVQVPVARHDRLPTSRFADVRSAADGDRISPLAYDDVGLAMLDPYARPSAGPQALVAAVETRMHAWLSSDSWRPTVLDASRESGDLAYASVASSQADRMHHLRSQSHTGNVNHDAERFLGENDGSVTAGSSDENPPLQWR